MSRIARRRIAPGRALGLAALTSLACLMALACGDQSTPSPDRPAPADSGADTSSGGGETRRPGVLRVGTFNVRQYFDTVCDTGMCGPNDFEVLPSQSAFDAKTEALAKGIALLDPDVIALEEVETTRCIDALVAKLSALGLTYPIAHLGETGSPGSVDVAILARGTVQEIKTHRDVPLKRPDGSSTTFTRELLEVRMTFGAMQVVMFAAHFRSKVDDDPGRRLAEAQAAQAIVAQTATELPAALVLLGGDLNDKPGSPPINALEAGGVLLRVASDVADQGTYSFQGTSEAIDHVFVGAGQAVRYVAKSAKVYHGDTGGGFAGSDHAALEADFTIE